MARIDRKARAEYNRVYNKKNPEKIKAYKRARVENNREIVASFRAEPCTDCKQHYPACVMQFDHVRGGKSGKRTVGTMVQGSSAKALLAEIDKCEIVCANCHAIRTHERGENRRGGHRKNAEAVVRFVEGDQS